MKKLLTLSFLLIPLSLPAQDGPGLRTGIGLKKNLTKKWSISAEVQTRFNGNISYLQTYLGELGVSYKITKGLEASACYRYTYRRKDETKKFKERHRYYADLSYGRKTGPVKLEYRIRYQHQFKDNDLGQAEFDNSYLRNKLEIQPVIRGKFTPYFSADLFYRIGSQIDQLRPKAGIEYKINKKNKVDVSIFKDIDLSGNEKYGPVLGLNYKIRL